ncbi:hypothetical protein PPYR_09992 [Photinus pyralis]|uniref:Akirin n=1 Tax=Photinus pyralis TaxID=7054 RepID=A0A1Y1JWR6_PHOPY|nr:akirin [Photinus pyralis]KAB0795931.1 hypothetical protein PPYR_09992 [Photinus pyralis]
MACATLKRSLDFEPVLGARPSKRRRCGTPFCTSPSSFRDKAGPSTYNPMNVSPPKPPSAFPDVATKKLTPEYMAASIQAELKRLHRRKQLQYSAYASDGSSSGGEQVEGAPSRPKDRALFTFKQVGLICERMMREREVEIREEYDNVLTAKLSEQYDAFVRFTYDQIQKNYEAVPSYLS